MEQTPEQIAQHYSAAMQSVKLINHLLEKTDRIEEDDATISRNVVHLQIMLEQPYWTTENLAPLKKAISDGNAALKP